MANEILKIEKELRNIMNTYQSELDGLEKDKTSAKRQLDKTMEVLKEKDYELVGLNKNIVRKDEEIKEWIGGWRLKKRSTGGTRKSSGKTSEMCTQKSRSRTTSSRRSRCR